MIDLQSTVLTLTLPSLDRAAESERNESQPPPTLPRSSGEELAVFLSQSLGEIQRGLNSLLYAAHRLFAARSILCIYTGAQAFVPLFFHICLSTQTGLDHAKCPFSWTTRRRYQSTRSPFPSSVSVNELSARARGTRRWIKMDSFGNGFPI